MTTEVKQVSLHSIVERENYRLSYDADLVASIAGDMSEHGFDAAHPIECYADGGQYVVIDGHTRLKAALLGSTYGLKSHQPDMVVWVAVKDKPSDAQFKLMQLSANELRVNPDPISQAIGYQQALDAGASIDDLIGATGHNRLYVEDRLSLLKLIPEARELVAKKHLGVRFAVELTRLDANFQHIALMGYNAMRAPLLDDFKALVDSLYVKMTQSSLFDLSLFSGKPIEMVLDDLKIERKATRAELESQLAAERQARLADRDYAKRKYQAAQAEIARLRAQLDAAKQPAKVSEVETDHDRDQIIAFIHANLETVRPGRAA